MLRERETRREKEMMSREIGSLLNLFLSREIEVTASSHILDEAVERIPLTSLTRSREPKLLGGRGSVYPYFQTLMRIIF